MIQSICGKRTPGRSVLFNSNIRYYGLSAVHSRDRLTTRARPPARPFLPGVRVTCGRIPLLRVKSASLASPLRFLLSLLAGV